MNHLVSCTGCSRHVRANDAICPFCGETLPLSLRQTVPRGPTERLGRAATFAFGAALAASTAAGCSESNTPTDAGGGTDAGTADAGTVDAGYDAGAIAPPYGLPPPDDAGYDAGPVAPPYGVPPEDAGYDAGGIAPPYGLPPVDAGTDGGGVFPPYGAPPAAFGQAPA